MSFQEILFVQVIWIYLIQSTFLMCHEIESAYWQEWKLFRLPGGISFFVILHIPIVFLVLLGLKLLGDKNYYGVVIALLVGLAGIIGFMIHRYFIRKGKEGFDLTISKLLLYGMLIFGIVLSVSCGFLLLTF